MDQLLLWAFAIPMAYAVAWIARRAAHAKSSVENAYAVFLLIMMASMLGGALLYLLNRSIIGIIEAVGINMGVMTVGILLVLKYWIDSGAVEYDVPVQTDANDPGLQRSIIITRAYVVYFIVFIASMISFAVIYIIDSSVTGLEAALGSGMGIMTVGVVLILRYSTQHNLSRDDPAAFFRLGKSSILRATIISLILANEFLMGWVFVLASGIGGINVNSNYLTTFSNIVSSYWFIFIMVLEMGLTIWMFRKEVPKSFAIVLAFQAAVMFLSPPAVDDQIWIRASVYAGSALMTVLFIFLYDYLYRNKLIESNISRYLLVLLLVYASMMAGLFVWIMRGDSLLFALSIIAEMGLYFNIVLAPQKLSGSRTISWLSNPMWIFGFLATTFIAEFFMGGLIDVVYYGHQFMSAIAFAPLTGFTLQSVSAALYNFFAFFTTITGSAWYLVMMGAEMGTLVIFKIRYTRELETKIRLGLVVLAYAAYTVYFPYFFFPSDSALAKVPFIGWNMGIGTSGPVAPVFIASIALTYMISGVLAFLFGGRQVCSMFCSASLMYQGTFPDSLKVFNRTSKIGKKLLTSRMSSIYKVVSSAVIVSLIVGSILSYLNSVHVINFTIYGNDAAVFLYSFYFDFLWYMIFLTIPFIGVYGCVTSGMCSWGMFNQFIGRLGFFKLKVKDPSICVKCPTKDCAKACPVGLTDLPSKFIASGEFKSHKCIGVGDCVSSCPYENEYFYDARHWIRGRLATSKGSSKLDLPIINYKPDSN